MSQEPKNRKTRRAEAKQRGETFTPLSSATQIPMIQPDRSGPKGKTLFDIADERNSLLQKGQPFSPSHGDGLVRDEQGRVILPSKDVSRASSRPFATPDNPKGATEGQRKGRDAESTEDDAAIGPLGDALILTITLTMLHFTLSMLVYNQYSAQPPTLLPVAQHSLAAAPFLFVFVYLLKLPMVAKRVWLKQGIHFVLGVGTGCYLIYIANRESYLAVMTRAPPLGSVWVWSVIEMKLIPAVASLAVCVAYLLWHGFSIM